MPITPAAGCAPIDPLCHALSGVGSGAANLVMAGLGDAFVAAAKAASDTALAAIDATTRVDLTASWFTANLAVIAAITLPAVVGLFALQVITSVLRREPGGLVRAVLGVGKATVGAAVAIALTQTALIATDQICQGVAATAGTTVSGAARRVVSLSYLAGPSGPVLQILLSMAIIIGCLLLWAVMLFRKAAVLLVAVFAPIAFAGAVYDHTRVWTRRWIEAITALVLCKVVIVVVFVLGAAAFGTQPGDVVPPGTAGLSDLLVGVLLLSVAICAPWLTFRFVHWSGLEAGTVLHGALVATPVPNAARSTAALTTRVTKSAAMSAALGPVGGAAGASGRALVAAGATSAASGPGGTPRAATSVLDRPTTRGAGNG